MQKKITPQEMKFCGKDFISKSIWSPQETANLVTFTQEIFTGKHFLCTHLFAVLFNRDHRKYEFRELFFIPG